MGFENAKTEFLEHVEDREVLCAWCVLNLLSDESVAPITMPIGSDLTKFLDQLDFSYDSGFGMQSLFGIIWYKDGSYSQRKEYHGSEWWEHRVTPKIPKRLMSRTDLSTEEKLQR